MLHAAFTLRQITLFTCPYTLSFQVLSEMWRLNCDDKVPPSLEDVEEDMLNSVCRQDAVCLFVQILWILNISLLQIAPNSTLHFLGPSPIHISSVKLIRWTNTFMIIENSWILWHSSNNLSVLTCPHCTVLNRHKKKIKKQHRVWTMLS